MNQKTLKTAIEIFKAQMPGAASGKYRAYIATNDAKKVEFYGENGYYCTINVRTGALRV